MAQNTTPPTAKAIKPKVTTRWAQTKSNGLGGAFCISWDYHANMSYFSKQSSLNGEVKARRPRGFTLIELMVVLAILGVLAALIVPNVLGRADDARVTAARADVNNLMQALKLYRLDNQIYPTAAQGLQALVQKPSTDPIPPNWRPYLDKLPNDPWGHPYQYLNPGLKSEVDVLSFGADGQSGGEGRNADIGSWQ
jgi:general secretion pathway protein G